MVHFVFFQMKEFIDVCMYIFLGIFTVEMMIKVTETNRVTAFYLFFFCTGSLVLKKICSSLSKRDIALVRW